MAHYCTLIRIQSHKIKENERKKPFRTDGFKRRRRRRRWVCSSFSWLDRALWRVKSALGILASPLLLLQFWFSLGGVLAGFLGPLSSFWKEKEEGAACLPSCPWLENTGPETRRENHFSNRQLFEESTTQVALLPQLLLFLPPKIFQLHLSVLWTPSTGIFFFFSFRCVRQSASG